MPTLAELLWLIVLPAAVVLGVRALAALTRRPAPERGGLDLLVAAALVAAFLGAAWFGPPLVRPSFPVAASETSFWWVFWFAPAGLLLAAVEPRLPVVARGLVRLAAGAGAGWLIVEPVASRLPPLGLALRLGLASLLTAALWSALADPRTDGRRHAVAVATIVALAAGGLVYVHVGQVATLGQTAAMLSAAVGAAAAPVPPTRPFLLPRAAAGAIALVAVALSLAGHTYLNVESPWHTEIRWPAATALLVAGAPLAGLLVPPRWPRLVTVVLAAALALAAVAGGAVAGGILDTPADHDTYGG